MVTNRTRFAIDTKALNPFSVAFEFFKSLSDEKMIFISHKHGESELVYRLFDLLKQYGFTGYVDWEDDNMPKETSFETAFKLKEKIIKSYKFILIATNAAIESKWCNWEVGLGDAHKYIDHIALFPLKDDNTDFNGGEYLSIYPTLQSNYNVRTLLNDYYIQYPNGDLTSLSEWLKI